MIQEELKIQLNNFYEEILLSYPFEFIDNSCKNLMYLRLSKLDSSLPKGDRIKDAISKLRADFNSLIDLYPNLKKDGFKLFVEIKSAYKNSTREVFIDLYSNHLFQDISSIKDILENKVIANEKNLYISSYDRLSRVFLYSLPFQIIRISRGINIFTLLPEEIEFEKKAKNILTKDNQDQLMFVFQLMMFSSSASKHSEDLSGKVKKRVSKKDGITVSNKSGKRWGAPKTISDGVRNKIKRFYKRHTAKEISENPQIYQVIGGIKNPISVNTIKKIVRGDK